ALGLAVARDQGVEEAVLPARGQRVDLGFERLDVGWRTPPLGGGAEEMQHRGPLLEEGDAVVDVARGAALLEQPRDAAAQVLAVALAREQHGRGVGATVWIGAQHQPRVLRALRADHLPDQRRVALDVAREQELDWR